MLKQKGISFIEVLAVIALILLPVVWFFCSEVVSTMNEQKYLVEMESTALNASFNAFMKDKGPEIITDSNGKYFKCRAKEGQPDHQSCDVDLSILIEAKYVNPKWSKHPRLFSASEYVGKVIFDSKRTLFVSTVLSPTPDYIRSSISTVIHRIVSKKEDLSQGKLVM